MTEGVRREEGKRRTIQEIVQNEAARSVDSIYEMHHSARPVLALAYFYEEALIILGYSQTNTSLLALVGFLDLTE